MTWYERIKSCKSSEDMMVILRDACPIPDGERINKEYAGASG